MFTGIIEYLGKVKEIKMKKNLIVYEVDCGALASKIKVADSVAINGVCLTATKKKDKCVSFDLMKETIERTSLKQIKKGSKINMELALRANARLGGHFVTGHVDEVGVIKAITKEPNWVAMKIGVSKTAIKHLVHKGSVTVDGISLTVGAVTKTDFEIYLIPYTLKVTNLSEKKEGDLLSIETDILAKYILKA